MKNVVAEFELKEEVFKWLQDVSSILGCPQTVIQGHPGTPITLNAVDVKGKIVDSALVELDTIATTKFKVVFSNDNIKVIPGTYNVKISPIGCALFTHLERKLKYWITIEAKSSSFEE